MKRTMPLRQNRQESCLANDQDRCQPAQRTATLEEQTDTSFIRTRYFSKSQQDSIPQTELGAENSSRRENFESIDSLRSHSEISTGEQAAHQDGLLASGPIPQLEVEDYAMSCNESMTESISENSWLHFLLTSSWEEGEGHPPYEPLLPLGQQFY